LTPVIVTPFRAVGRKGSGPDLPEYVARRLPRYPLIPATLIGRRAIDRRYPGCIFRGKSAADSGMKSATDSDVISAIPI
jgi:hypothetical protein